MAVVELAVCLPVLVLIIMGSIEACNLTFLKQKLTEAAYQGAMVATQPQGHGHQDPPACSIRPGCPRHHQLRDHDPVHGRQL